MDSMFIWMLIFAGATIGLLAIFLIASERELKAKRREIEALAAKLDGSGESSTDESSMAMQPADADAIANLKQKNRQFLEEISTLTEQLEASGTQFRELDDRMRRLSNVEPENHRLRADNEQLLEEVARLKNEIQQQNAHDSLAHAQEQAWQERHDVQQTELRELKAQLDRSQASVQEMDNLNAQLADAQIREQAIKDRCGSLEMQLDDLKEQLAASRDNMLQSATLQTQLHDIAERYAQAQVENQRLQEESSSWHERLAASRETAERIGMLRQHVNDLCTKQTEVTQRSQDIQEQTLGLARLLDDSLAPGYDSNELITPYGSTDSSMTATAGENVQYSSEEMSLATAKQYIDAGRFHDALKHLDELLKEAPNDREMRLYHLLASVRLYQADGYETQIDAITRMEDLTDSERVVARDIFLARAEEAQKRGRDDEMLRYRAWAKNVIYHTLFGLPGNTTPTQIGGQTTEMEFARGNGNEVSGDEPFSASATNGGAGSADNGQPGNKRGRFVTFAALIGLVVAGGAIVTWSLGDHAGTAAPTSDVTAQKLGAGAPSETGASAAPTEREPSAASNDSPAVPALPQDKGSTSRPSRQSPDVTEKKPDRVARAPRRDQGGERPITREQARTKKQEQTTVNVPQSFRGSFEVVRPTQVLSEPRAGSSLLAHIDPGTRVNVVADRNGWLEIRSKYGRPPGFIPREAVGRIQQN